MSNIDRRTRKGSKPVCGSCGSSHVSVKVATVGHAKCLDCGHSERALSIATNGVGNDNPLGTLIGLGLVILGASVVGAVLDSIAGSKKEEALPNYDEDDWQSVFR